MKDYSNYYPSYKDVMLGNGRLMFELQLQDFDGKDIKIGDKPTRGLVRYHQSPLSEFKQDRKLTVWAEDDLHTGSYVTTLDDERMFLAISQINQTEIVKSCLIRECNLDLKWIDDETGELIVRPCIENAKTLYTTGVKEEKVIEIPNGMVGIQLPAGDIAKRLNRNKRFVFNKTSYRVTFYDETNYEGIIALICSETGLSHLDDKVNNIADRWMEVNGEIIDRLPWLDEQEPGKPPIIDPIEPPEEGIYYSIEIEKQYGSDVDYQVSSYNWQKYTISKFVDNEKVEGEFDFALSEDVEGLDLMIENSNSCKLQGGDIVGDDITINLIVTDIDTNEMVIEQEIVIKGR